MGFLGVLGAFLFLAVGDLLFVASRSSLYRGRNTGITVYLCLAAHEFLLILQLVCLITLLSRTYWVAAGMLLEIASTLKVVVPLLLVKAFLTAFPAVYRDALLPRKRNANAGPVNPTAPGTSAVQPPYSLRGWSDGGYGVLVVLDLIVSVAFTLSCFHVVFLLAEKTLYPPYHIHRTSGSSGNNKKYSADELLPGGGGGTASGGGVGWDSTVNASYQGLVTPAGSIVAAGGGARTGSHTFSGPSYAGNPDADVSAAWMGRSVSGGLRSEGQPHYQQQRLRPSATGSNTAGPSPSTSVAVDAPFAELRGRPFGAHPMSRQHPLRPPEATKGAVAPVTVGFKLPGEAEGTRGTPRPPTALSPAPDDSPPDRKRKARVLSPTPFEDDDRAKRPSPSPSPTQESFTIGPVAPLELRHKFTTSSTEYPSYLNSFAAALLRSGFDSKDSTGTMITALAGTLNQRMRRGSSDPRVTAPASSGSSVPRGESSSSGQSSVARNGGDGAAHGYALSSRRSSVLSETARHVSMAPTPLSPGAAGGGQQFMVDRSTGLVVPCGEPEAQRHQSPKPEGREASAARSAFGEGGGGGGGEGGAGGSTSASPPPPLVAAARESSGEDRRLRGGHGSPSAPQPTSPVRQVKYNPLHL